MTTVEKSYRGISERLARRYLSNLGGEIECGDGTREEAESGDGRESADADEESNGSEESDSDEENDADVVADDWRASVSSETVEVGPSVTLTEVTVVFEGDEETLDSLVEDFSQKAMRAGG